MTGDIDQEWAELLDALSRDVFWLMHDISCEEAPSEDALKRVQNILDACWVAIDKERKQWIEEGDDDIPF